MERGCDLLAQRELDELLHRRLSARHLADDAAVPQHRRPVADTQDLAIAMADEDDRDALVAQTFDDAEEPVDVGLPERRRRLVEDQDPRLPKRQHLGDLDELALGERDLPDLLRRVDRRHSEAAERARGVLRDRPLVDRERARRLGAERDVVCDRQVRQQAQLLVDDADPELVRPPRRRDFDLLAVDLDPARRRLVVAGEHLEQRRLPRAVLAYEAVDRRALDDEIDAVERERAREALGHGRDAKERRSGLGHVRRLRKMKAPLVVPRRRGAP